ncbi:leucine-rich repeat protein [Butyrivibrio sp. AE3006]|uniref:leucine-rich repeat protein n=1 Tax=Butyrivibrio sp. AE3006 TaxID=1280673 RepID=UPI000478B445|nr:leucine-rich repeat protein [Butyrivibrio sp. AE3006]
MKIKKRFLGFLLSLVMVLGLMPGMSLTAYADGTTYNPASTYTGFGDLITNDTEVTISEVSGKTWYVIANDSSTVTLLSKQSFANQAFNSDTSKGNNYETSDIKKYVDGLTGEGQPLEKISRVISDLTLIDKITAQGLSVTKAKGAGVDWWLCSQGNTYNYYAAFVYGGSGAVDNFGSYVYNNALGVRPALKLNLSSVIFESGTNTFSLKPYSVTLSGGANATIDGATSQTGLTGAMTTVTYTANTGYYFAEFTDITNNGITAKRTSSTVVTVSGTPTSDATITVPDAVEKTAATVTKENADGKTIVITNYSKTDEQISQFVFKKAKGTTVDLTNVSSNSLKTVVVPETVNVNGKTYKVTRIRKGFLKNCTQATKVDIGKNVNTIDKNAFNYGKKVKTIIIRGKLTKVGKGALKNTKKNVTIEVKTGAKNFGKNKKLLVKSELPKNATVKRVKNKK